MPGLGHSLFSAKQATRNGVVSIFGMDNSRLIWYSSNSKSYRVYTPTTRRIMESRNVIFIGHRRGYSCHLWKNHRPSVFRRKWTATITSLTTTFYWTFTTSLRCWTSCLVVPSITSLLASFQRTLKRLDSWIGPMTSPGETCCKEDVPGYRKREFRQGESHQTGPCLGKWRWRNFHRSSRCHPKAGALPL